MTKSIDIKIERVDLILKTIDNKLNLLSKDYRCIGCDKEYIIDNEIILNPHVYINDELNKKVTSMLKQKEYIK